VLYNYRFDPINRLTIEYGGFNGGFI
jgi:hypothetical protein